MSIEEVTITTKNVQDNMRAGTELPLIWGVCRKWKRREKKKDKAGSRQEFSEMSQNPIHGGLRGGGAAHGSLIRWKLTAGPEGCLLSNMRTQPASRLPLSWVENPLPPSNRSLIQVNKSLFKCGGFLASF